MKQLEKFFDIETPYSKKHVLNTCNRKVPQEYLDEIEMGCSIEQLETMMRKKFDVFKYKTQITIHGIFPELSTRRVGTYVNLTQNKNLSIGVRYTAIDREKKSRLYRMLNTLGLYSIEENSQTYSIYKMEELPSDWKNKRDEIMAIVRRFKAEAERIDKSLFVGNVSCYVANGLWRTYMCLDVNVCCFYEHNFEKLFETLSGMTWAEGKKLYDEKIAEKRRKDAEREAEMNAMLEKSRKEREEAKAALAERKKAFAEEHPLDGFRIVENYVPKSGDIIAIIHADYEYKLSWRTYRLRKCFGTVKASPCGTNGEKVYVSYGGGTAKASYPTMWVKKSA